MATYKVIQDIEAEDKLLGPLSLRQFIYAIVVIVLGFIAFKLAMVSPLLVVPFLPPMIFFGMLAAPFGHDQSSEVWLLAKIGFLLKPRRRIWNQSGIQDLVTITVPKKVEHVYTDGLSQTEVKGRLRALADTIDSRGWAVKNVNVNMSAQPYQTTTGASDRLIDVANLPHEVPSFDVLATDDMLDEKNSLTAQHLDTMINQSEQAHRQAMLDTVQGKTPAAAPTNDYWFMNQPDPASIPTGMATFTGSQTVAPGAQPAVAVDDSGTAEQALLDQIHKEQSRPDPGQGHMKVLDPNGPQAPVPAPLPLPDPQKAAALAQLANNDDLNIATIARQAEKVADPGDGEVVISLR